MRLSSIVKSNGSSAIRLGLSAGEANTVGLLARNASRRFALERVGDRLILTRTSMLPSGKSPKGTKAHTFSANMKARNPGHHPGYSLYFRPVEVGLADGVSIDATDVNNRMTPDSMELALPGVFTNPEITLKKSAFDLPAKAKKSKIKKAVAKVAKVRASHTSSRIREGVNVNVLAAAIKKLNGLVGNKGDAVTLVVNERGLIEAEIIHRRMIGGVLPRR